MYNFIIGCDISKLVFDVAYSVDDPVYLGCFSNDNIGFKQTITKLKTLTEIPIDQWLFVFEHTGVYSKPLKKYLLKEGIACMEENALKIKRSAPMKRGKSDPIDAKMICEYAMQRSHKLKADSPTDEIVDKLKLLVNKREGLIKQRTALKVSYQEQKTVMDNEIKEFLNQVNQELIDVLNAKIKAIEQQMKAYINQKESIQKNYELVTSVVGIGFITATIMICITDNFTKCKNSREMSCYAGIAPFPNESGKRRGKHRISVKGNKLLKKTISNCVQAAIMYDPFFRSYYDRLRAKNKAKGIIYNNIKNKLFARVFSTINRQSPYVKLTYQ